MRGKGRRSATERANEFVDDAELFGFGGRDVAAADDHVERRLRTDEARQALRAAAARDDADQDFRLSDPGARHGDAVVAGERNLEPAAERIAVDRGGDRLLARIEDVVHPLPRDRARPVRAELTNVGAGNEGAAGADQYHRFDRRVGVAALDTGDDALGHTRRQCVDRRIVDRDDADPVDRLETDQFAFRHVFLLC
jgi:hypothetical protein